MEKLKADFDNWHIEILPKDGGRISVLKYSGQNLLTTEPENFKSPENDYGEYETRPVYGYDDCFPTVDACEYPAKNFDCKDHGQLCWQEFETEIRSNKIVCSTECAKPEVTFIRTLEFAENSLTWHFEVINRSKRDLPFLHVMHPLMPLREMQSIQVPEFKKVINESSSIELEAKNAAELSRHLLDIKPGDFEMLLLKNIEDGFVDLTFKSGMKLKIEFDSELFPTLGIWWNNKGYPDEDGLRRIECAFEPIGGTCSNLLRTFKAGEYMTVAGEETFKWTINWKIIN